MPAIANAAAVSNLADVSPVRCQGPDHTDRTDDDKDRPNGYHGSHAKARNAARSATMTPTVRAQIIPENNVNPARRMTIPEIRCIHPQAVVSNLKK